VVSCGTLPTSPRGYEPKVAVQSKVVACFLFCLLSLHTAFLFFFFAFISQRNILLFVTSSCTNISLCSLLFTCHVSISFFSYSSCSCIFLCTLLIMEMLCSVHYGSQSFTSVTFAHAPCLMRLVANSWAGEAIKSILQCTDNNILITY